MADTDLTRRTRKVLGLARKAVNQWLDAPDDRVARPLFVFGCQRSGTTMLIDTLMQAPQLWSIPEASRLAFVDYRLRAPAIVDRVVHTMPADTVVLKPLCDSHLADKVLDAHAGARAIWLVRDWRDVASSAVFKWGGHQAEVVRDLLAGHGDRWTWRSERVPEALLAQLRAAVDAGGGTVDDATGAALFWFLRNSFFFMLGLDHDERVELVRYEDLVSRPADTFPALFAHIGVDCDPAWLSDIEDRRGKSSDLTVPAPVAALCDALAARFLAA